MSRALDDLDARFLPQASALLARAAEIQIPLLIVCTRRTVAEQAVALATGHSWVTHSKHLDGLAMDVVPYAQFTLHGTNKLQWNVDDPAWATLAALAERLGLRSGYRWQQKDAGHVELPETP